MALSFIQSITLSLSKLSLLQRMASNDNNNSKRKLEEEAESTTVRKRLWLFDDNSGDDDSPNSLKEDMEEEELSSKEMSMNQLDTSEGKLFAKRTHGSDDGDTTSPSSEPRTPENLQRSDE
jgi:hypothetical protein